jgi:hypothetical protein
MKLWTLTAAAGALAVSTGCASTDGVWLIEVAAPQNVQECDAEATDWNIIGANPPAESSSSWVTEEDQKLSNSLFFAQIVNKGSNAVLLINDVAYPSVEGSKGKTWTFQWEGQTQDIYDAAHQFGYNCKTDVTTTSTVTYDITLDGKYLTGSVTSKADYVAKYEESDIWVDEANGAEQCAIPWGQFLEILMQQGPNTNFVPAANDQEDPNCSGDPCTMKVEQHCNESMDLVGTLTGLNGDEAYDNVDDAGQSFGI